MAKQEKDNNVIKALSYVFTKKEKIYLIYIALLVLVGGVLEMLAVAIFTPFIEAFTNEEAIGESKILSFFYNTFKFKEINDFIVALAGLIIVIYIVKNLYLTYEKNTVYKFSYSLQLRIGTRLIKAYLQKPYTFHLKTNPAELLRTIQVDADYFSKTVIHVIELAIEIFVCMTLVVYLFFVSPTITLTVAAFLVVTVTAYIAYSKGKLRRMAKRNQGYTADILKTLNQSFGGIKEIKVLGREQYFVDKYTSSMAKSVRCFRIGRLASVLPKYCVEAVCIVGLMLAVIIQVKTKPESVSSFIPQMAVFATAAFRLMPSVGRINEHTAAINSNAPSVFLIYKDLKSVEEFTGEDVNAAEGKIELKDRICVDDVTFYYPDNEQAIIENVSFDILKGKTVAFIGESGAGKTTMADIILGVLEPTKGRILADGTNVYDNLPMWQRNIGYIPQTIYLSDDTIRNNIAFGIDAKDIDDNAVMEAAKKAQLQDFIASLPDGLDTVVGERGARLSGGQRQRIGIARALYHDPEILVLDEATSALDNETEAAVMEAIDGLHGVKTMIVIAHRLSTIRNADTILEVTKGKVIERNKEEVLA